MSENWREVLGAAFGIVLGCAFATALVELAWMRHHGTLTRARLREMALSLSAVPPNAVASFATAGAWALVFTAAHALAPVALPVNAFTVAAALLAVDFTYYWEHRCAHRVRVLWSLYHAFHHSSPDYTVATAYRVSFVNHAFTPAFYLPCVLLGFHPLLVFALQLIVFHYQAWIHTEAIGRLGWMDYWFNTPAAHRMHHSSAPEHADRNMGAVTLVWDRLFGTFAPPEEKLRYGIAGEQAPRGWLAVYVDPMRRRARARGARDVA
jgi:sterol desaturase/sphingolipid hydroxylase (fatty acid hydroxylase superfamily)